MLRRQRNKHSMDIEKPKELYLNSKRVSESVVSLIKNPESGKALNLEINNANFIKNDYREEARRVL